MPQTFFALCKPNDVPTVRRLAIDAGVQNTLEELFTDQEANFRAGIENEVEFTGDWKPDEDEALYVTIPNQTTILEQAIQNAPLAVPVLDAANFTQEGVKAIFTGYVNDGQTVVAIQKFTPQQILGRKFALIFTNNVLNELTDPTFTLDNKLVGLIEGGNLKFKSYHNIRMIFDLSDLYRAATDDDIDHFAAHACLEVADLDALKGEVDQTARKLIHAIQKNGVLDLHTANEIQRRAGTVGLDIIIQNGRVLMPEERAEIKRLLRFLHDDIYEAPLSHQRYVTNSKKPD